MIRRMMEMSKLKMSYYGAVILSVHQLPIWMSMGSANFKRLHVKVRSRRYIDI